MSRNNKTLIFSFDGTGNEPMDAKKFEEDESISNVMKLHVLMGGGFHKDDSDTRTPGGRPQKTYYYNGIGTREDGVSFPLLGRLRQAINMAVAPTFGDARRILQEAKTDFAQAEYARGDTLVVFGFSRGAALARKFASKVLTEHPQCEVSFLGVFDTVAAMDGIHRKGERISSDVVFENGTLNDRIKKAVHILSLDEDRVPFTPTLMNKDDSSLDRILEVWFPGVHGDVGGGYWFDGLSDLALDFMIKACKQTLLDLILIEPGNNNDKIRALLAGQSELADIEVDDVAINPLVNGVMHVHAGLGLRVMGQEPRRVYVADNNQPSTNASDLPLLHHSVKERFFHVANYRPPALRGLKFKLLDSAREVHGISGLRAL